MDMNYVRKSNSTTNIDSSILQKSDSCLFSSNLQNEPSSLSKDQMFSNNLFTKTKKFGNIISTFCQSTDKRLMIESLKDKDFDRRINISKKINLKINLNYLNSTRRNIDKQSFIKFHSLNEYKSIMESMKKPLSEVKEKNFGVLDKLSDFNCILNENVISINIISKKMTYSWTKDIFYSVLIYYYNIFLSSLSKDTDGKARLLYILKYNSNPYRKLIDVVFINSNNKLRTNITNGFLHNFFLSMNTRKKLQKNVINDLQENKELMNYLTNNKKTLVVNLFTSNLNLKSKRATLDSGRASNIANDVFQFTQYDYIKLLYFSLEELTDNYFENKFKSIKTINVKSKEAETNIKVLNVNNMVHERFASQKLISGFEVNKKKILDSIKDIRNIKEHSLVQLLKNKNYMEGVVSNRYIFNLSKIN